MSTKKPSDVVALPSNKQLAKRVAQELARRQRRRKLLLLLLLAAAIALALTYGTCGRGWGLGGKGKGDGAGSGPGSGPVQGVMTVVDAGVTRCALRLTAAGITVDGKSMTREEAITACKATQGADVIVTGDARTGDWEDLQAAMLEAKLEWVELKAGGVGAADRGSGTTGSNAAGSNAAGSNAAGSNAAGSDAAGSSATSAGSPASSGSGAEGTAAEPPPVDAGVELDAAP